MTDNEIIKALECLSGVCIPCKRCAYRKIGYPKCKTQAALDALNLINRQKAEIGTLEKAIKVQEIMLDNQDYMIKKAKAKAVKDFLIRLTMHFASYRGKDTITIKDMFQIIQKIAEETVGEKNVD